MYLYPEFNTETTLKTILLPFFISLLLLGCKKEISSPVFSELTLDQVSTLNCDPEEENCAYISIHIPWIENPEGQHKLLNDKIEQHVIQLVDYHEETDPRSMKALSQNFIENYEATAIEFPEYSIPWEASVEGKVIYSSPELISIEFDLALFTGGAHGYTSRSYLNLDPATGDRVSNEELFTGDFKSYVENIFRKKHNIPAGEPINSTGYFFEDDRFHLPQNIGILENKVILRYNAYEVASYAEGGIQFSIPKHEVIEFIKIF